MHLIMCGFFCIQKKRKGVKMKYEKAIKEINKAFNLKGINFETAGEVWKRYKRILKNKGE